jgi:hypothetical protein
MIVPCATLPPAVPEFELPAADDVVKEMIALPIAQVAELVDGVTLANTQVVEAPEYEYTVRLGLQAVGAMTEVSAFSVTC